jgi:hypothetical protein
MQDLLLTNVTLLRFPQPVLIPSAVLDSLTILSPTACSLVTDSIVKSLNIVTNKTIVRQRFDNMLPPSEQARKSIVSQLLAKHTFPWQRIKQSNTRAVGNCDLYSVLLEVSSVQDIFVVVQSSEFSVQLWSVNQRTTEAEEVTDS